MLLALSTTWSLVMMMPSSEKMTPLPAPLWIYWPKKLLRLTVSVLISTTEGEARAAISLTERAPPVYPAWMPAAGAWALRYTGGFTLAALVISAIREVLSYGTLWGFDLPEPLRLAGAQMPFFGFIMFGVFSAGYQWIRRLAAELREAMAPGGPGREEGGGRP